MEKYILVIILVLLLIILLLLTYILHPPQSKIETASKYICSDQSKQKVSSVIGLSTTIMLESKPKPKSHVVSKEELDEVFETEEYSDEDFDHGYDDEATEEATEEEVGSEDPVGLENTLHTDNDELQKKECLDYIQIESASRAVVKGYAFTEDNKETLRKLQGTELLNSVLEQMNGKCTDNASDLIDKLGLF